MVKVNELRIGNWLIEKTGTQCGILYRNVKVDEDFLEILFASRNYNNLEPIPLTPKILEKAGFKVWQDKTTYSKEFDNGNAFQIRGNEVSLGGDDSCTGGMVFILEIHYLHQLQNLYFALTGEELNIQL